MADTVPSAKQEPRPAPEQREIGDINPGCRITARLREQAGHEVAGRGITPAETARHAGISWPIAHAAFAASKFAAGAGPCSGGAFGHRRAPALRWP